MDFVALAQTLQDMQQRIGTSFGNDSDNNPLVLRERMQIIQQRLREIQTKQDQVDHSRIELAEALRKTRSLDTLCKAIPEVTREVKDFENSLQVAKMRAASTTATPHYTENIRQRNL